MLISIPYNGKLSTHSLAMIITQPESGSEETSHDTIARISKHEMAELILSDQDVYLTATLTTYVYCTSVTLDQRSPR